MAPRELSTDQPYILKELIEAEDLRGKAMFSLGYYAGCRASDVCWFRLGQVHHLTKKSGYVTVCYKRGQLRTIDLANEARKALRIYLEEVVVSLGHVTRKGTPAVATTARYTQPNREQMKHKLKDLSL